MTQQCKYKLKEGKLIWLADHQKHYNNNNLTDEVAELLIARGLTDLFEKIPEQSVVEKEVDAGGSEEVAATNAARELANDKNLILSDICGSGKDGKITKKDVEQYLEINDY